jgi:predicted esterase
VLPTAPPANVKMVHSLVEKELELGIPASNLVLGGFSQGGALALHALPNCHSPMLQCHGVDDGQVGHLGG